MEVEPPPNCGPDYTAGTVVTLTAAANSGYVFHHWSGSASGSVNPISGVMDGPKSLTAHFEEVSQPCYALLTEADPAGSGSVQVEPPPNCGGEYLSGTVVTLTAVANTGYTFDHWSGDASGSTNPVSLPMDGDKTIVAHFRSRWGLYLPLLTR